MARIWIENGKVSCCSEICYDNACPRFDKCQEIESPVKLQQEVAHYKELAQLNIDKYFEAMSDKARLVEALHAIRNDSRMWNVAKISGCNKYQGMPPLCRYIDGILKEMEG